MVFLLVPATYDPPSLSQISSAIDLAKGYTEQVCGSDGRFAYGTSIQSGKQNASYNIVRHAGAIYALTMMQSRPDQAAVETAVRAASFLQKNYIGPGAHEDQQVVWSKPLPQSSAADLGATGLGLVALAAVKQEQPSVVPLQQLQALGNFLMFLQREDGSFVSKYRLDTGPDEAFDSLYYPGEAALGFIDLYKIDHNERWLTAATSPISSGLSPSLNSARSICIAHEKDRNWLVGRPARLLRFRRPRRVRAQPDPRKDCRRSQSSP